MSRPWEHTSRQAICKTVQSQLHVIFRGISTFAQSAMIFPQDSQVGPLIQVFELYMLRDAALTDMREPTMVATRAMLDAGLAPEVILTVLDGAVEVATTGTTGTMGAQSADYARELREHIGPWLMGEYFDPDRPGHDVPLIV